MSYARKNVKNIAGSIVGVIVLASIAVWQIHQFVTFENEQGGTGHLVWAIAMTIMAFGVAFLVFSAFLRHDTDDDLHITSTGRA